MTKEQMEKQAMVWRGRLVNFSRQTRGVVVTTEDLGSGVVVEESTQTSQPFVDPEARTVTMTTMTTLTMQIPPEK